MKIKTENHEYLYDNRTGLILPNFSIINSILNLNNWHILSNEEIANILEDTFNREKIFFYHTWLKKYKVFYEENHISRNLIYDNESLKHTLLQYGFNQLILSITEDCNFRCSYCAYSNQFKYSRNHSIRYMSFDVAKKAVDIYLNFISKGRKYNLFRKPTFSFYGGEPLLNFSLIKRLVKYIKSIYSDEIQFTITTNGSLLNKNIINYLIKNDFSILVSLDGDKNEHNRKRKYKNNQGTFKDVFNNVKYLIEKNYDNIFMVPVFDWKTNFISCENFFKENNLKVLSISQVDNVFTNSYYNQFNFDDLESYKKLIKNLKETYCSEGSNYSYLYHLIEYPYVSVILDSNIINYTKRFNNFTASCTPGDKLYVNVDGEFHMCERVPEIKPLGDVFSGIDFDNILNMINDFNSKLTYCNECEVSFLCQKCYRNFMKGNSFKTSSEICINAFSEFKQLLTESMEFMEKNQSIEKFHTKYPHLINWRD